MKLIHRRSSLLLAATIALLVIRLDLAAAESFAIAPPAEWVKVLTLEARTAAASNHISGGEVYVLLDKQVNAATEETYLQIVRDIVSETGLQNATRISIRFDPIYQQLTFHHIRLFREGRALERLDRTKVKVIQQERDLERHIYDGSLSAVMFLEDVRVGDRIDYAYTLRGVNPILGGRHVDSFSVQWSLPMQRQQFRLLWPAARTLSFRSHSTTAQPTTRPSGDSLEYLWEFQDSPPVSYEEDAPPWHDAFGWVQLSEFPTWASVAKWATELYPPATLTTELSDKIREWEQASSSEEGRMLAALQFLQDDVRYLGLEFGPGSHRPTAPGVVFERRFGDCKDKAYLLCAVLRELGIDATPALVNTTYRATIANWLPSPYAFNHVVARIRFGGREYWVDPTRSQQRGPLASRFFPDYGRALLVHASTVDLAVIPPLASGLPKTTVQEFFTVRGRTEAAEFRIVTTSEGLDAERLRANFADNSREEMSKSYLNFYAKQYPKIQVSQPLEVLDQPASNIMQTIEHYRIEEFWTLADDKRFFTTDFYPLTLAEVLVKPSTKLRSAPLGVPHPRRQLVRTEVKLPEPWPINEEPATFTSPAGKLSVRREIHDQTLVMEFDYQSLTNEISTTELPGYLKTLDRIDVALAYQLTWQNEDAPPTAFQPNWSILVLAGFYSLLLVIGATLLCRWRLASPPPLPVNEPSSVIEPHLEGLAGWLVLVALGLILSPFRVGSIIAESHSAYSIDEWHALTMPGTSAYHALWAPYLIFALLANLTSIAFAVLLLVLFFKRRRTFPHLYIAYLVFSLLVVAIDHFGARALPGVADTPESQTTGKDVARSVMGCCVWIPYMLVSRRVRATFVR